MHTGYNLITLVNHLHYDPNRIVLLQLKAKTEPWATGVLAPTITIAQDSIRSYIFAQGLETEEPWDGIITISENIGYVESRLALYGITDGISVDVRLPVSASVDEYLDHVTSGMQMYGISDTITVGLEYGEQYLRCGAGHRAGNGRMFAPLTI